MLDANNERLCYTAVKVSQDSANRTVFIYQGGEI